MRKILITLALFISAASYAQTELDFNKLNEQYYRIELSEFPGFSADVTSDMIDMIRGGIDDKLYLSALDSIRITLDFFPFEDCSVKVNKAPETGNAQFDAGVKQMSESIKQLVQGGIQAWRGITFMDAFNPDKFKYDVMKTGDGYQLSYENDGTKYVNYINSSFVMDSVNTSKNGSGLTAKFHFTEYKNKKLLDAVEYSIGLMTASFQISYKEIGGFLVPEIFSIAQKGLGGEVKTKIILINIALHENFG